MRKPQTGILRQVGAYHYFLEFSVPAEVPLAKLRPELRAVWAPRQVSPTAAIQTQEPTPCCVLAFGSGLWRRLSDAAGLVGFDFAEFVEVSAGPGTKKAPATQHDLLVWFHGSSQDQVLALAHDLTARLARQGAKLEVEVAGRQFHDSRDLTGFIDGVANPSWDDQPSVALVPDGPRGGGSFLMTQRWRHQGLQEFYGLPINEQELIVGRSKDDGELLESWPLESHVGRIRHARSDTKVLYADGAEDKRALNILRRSVPFGSIGEPGLYFLGFSCELERFKALLGLMFNPPSPKKQDPLTQFSLPDTGSFWFAPALGDLNLALQEPALNSVIPQGTLPDNLKEFNEAWIPTWPGVIARAWSDDDFRQQLQKEPRKIAAGELQLPLFDADLVVKEGINRGTFVFALIDDIPLPTSQWQAQWPGIIAEIRRNPALKAEFLGDTQAFCERRRLPFLEHILLAVDESADRHKVIMPIPDPGQEVADYIRPILLRVVQSSPPCYASSSCC